MSGKYDTRTDRYPASSETVKSREGREIELCDDEFVGSLFAAAETGDVDGGWQLLRQSNARQQSYLDVCYVACYLAYRRGDYEETECWGKRYIQLHESPETPPAHDATMNKLHEVLNTMACVARDRGDDQTVLAYAKHAIAVAPEFPLPYVNGALAARRQGREAEAQSYITDGIARCGEVEALRLLEQGSLRDLRISLCMIVRDEEEMLPGALESVKDVVDEMIVVDTGSTDRTVEIATSYGARVFHHPWEGDFSKARNLSIGYASGDWILILDADERLSHDSKPLVRRLVQTCCQAGISFSVYNINLEDDDVSFLPSVRMFRNGRGYRYEGIVHNQLMLPRGAPVMRAPLRIDHYGYSASIVEKRGKFERTLELLVRQLKENPDDAFAHFNLAQLMRSCASCDRYHADIVTHATRATELIDPEDRDHLHVLLMALHQIASSQLTLGASNEAEAACRKALELKPDYLDALLTLGQSLLEQGELKEAKVAFMRYLEVREAYDETREASGFILLHLESQHQAYYGLGRIAEALGDVTAAIGWYRRALFDRKADLDAQARLDQLNGDQGGCRPWETMPATAVHKQPSRIW